MELLKVITDRRSIRRFKQDAVPDEMLWEVLDAARLAPSGYNCQPTRFVIVKDQSCKEKLAEVVPQTFATKAPVVIAACADKHAMSKEYLNQRTEELLKARAFFIKPDGECTSSDYSNSGLTGHESGLSYLRLNVAIAIDHLTLRAVDLGLGTCWVMQFDRKKVKEILALNDQYEPLVLLPIGFPAQHPKRRPRLNLQDILIKEI